MLGERAQCGWWLRRICEVGIRADVISSWQGWLYIVSLVLLLFVAAWFRLSGCFGVMSGGAGSFYGAPRGTHGGWLRVCADAHVFAGGRSVGHIGQAGVGLSLPTHGVGPFAASLWLVCGYGALARPGWGQPVQMLMMRAALAFTWCCCASVREPASWEGSGLIVAVVGLLKNGWRLAAWARAVWWAASQRKPGQTWLLSNRAGLSFLSSVHRVKNTINGGLPASEASEAPSGWTAVEYSAALMVQGSPSIPGKNVWRGQPSMEAALAR